jgi:hypothetical protein
MRDIIYYFFWWIAGAKVKYLKKYETEHEKYFHIGMTIFLTWLLATMGGTYAFYIIFGNFGFALMGGLVWGLIIFNLDRYMMVTIKKNGTVLRRLTFGEKIGNFIQEIIPTIPRIIIALILGILITTPLEVYIFKDQINNHIQSNKQALIDKNINQTHSNYLKQKNSMETAKRTFEQNMKKSIIETKESIKNIDSQIKESDRLLLEYPKKIEEIQEKYFISLKGTDTIPSGPGPISDAHLAHSKSLQLAQTQTRLELEQKKKKREKLSDKLGELEDKLKEKRKNYIDNIAKLSQQQQTNINKYKNDIKFDGLINQIGILHSIIDEQRKEKDDTLYHIHLVLMTLIMIFETSPILFKILSSKGPYEMEIDSMSNKSLIQSEIELRKFTVDIKKKYFNSD